MERLNRLLLSRWILGFLLLITLAGSLHSAKTLHDMERENELITHPESLSEADAESPLLAFARAYHLQEKGEPLEAIRIYGSIQQQGDNAFRARVHYNLGTLYLRDAVRLWKDRGLLEYARINTLLAAAKESLRESLSLLPDQWAAKYNLEIAHRITPPPKERPKEDFQGSKGSVFATLPAIPGGGP